MAIDAKTQQPQLSSRKHHVASAPAQHGRVTCLLFTSPAPVSAPAPPNPAWTNMQAQTSTTPQQS